MGKNSHLAAISHFGLLRLTAPKNSTAFTFGSSSCCCYCWQILCQKVADRTVQLHHHQAPATVMDQVTWLSRASLPKHLMFSWRGSHWTDRPGCDGLFTVCPWPWDPLSSFLHEFLCSVCFSSLKKHTLNFSYVHVSEAVGGSGNCTDGDPAGLGLVLEIDLKLRHFTCWSLISSTIKWGQLN